MLNKDIKQEILEVSNIEISKILDDPSLDEEQKDSQIKEIFNNIQTILFYEVNEQLNTVNDEIATEIKKSEVELEKVLCDSALNAEQQQTAIEKIIQDLITMIDKLFQQKRNEKVVKQEKLAILKEENEAKLNSLLDKAFQETNSDSETR
ncbi:hypothetical protein [Spiroplasma eriocheiris]|uniref:Uncharacterized protein n=1 Tax=Spiroplasma eriocheiris TaxID=315358 RepID=A0A0H3XHX4_9MOLU|nr:hypothetical protein [Spiroplasma eriocheiris]AHF57558.1 hypothetical protein SPE_0429 [Spiroplasma eriocheiris CCTCC M 207170]AKM54015.1 hypothetical protein SERIO_v1c04360 [Spiroplasma eriocheiris]